MLNEKYNFSDVFMRDLTNCVLTNLEEKIRWTNVFESGPKDVNCKIYYSLSGSEDFLMDSFVDDIASENRLTELNTDAYPRGHITLSSFRTRSEEFANPNVWLKMVVENHEEMRNVLAKVRALPITAQYELNVLVNSEVDTFKATQSILNTLWLYKYMYFEHNFMNIDSVMVIPDDQQIEISREHNLTNNREIKLSVPFEVQTYYPAYNENVILPAHGVEWHKQVSFTQPGKITDPSFDMELSPDEASFVNDNVVDIKIKLSRPANIKVKVFNHLATIIDELTLDKRLPVGEHTIKLKISNKSLFTTGVYYIKVEADDERKTLPLVIDR